MVFNKLLWSQGDLKIKRFAVLLVVFGVIVSLALKTIITFTLCGGTLMQNWVGAGACSDQQTKFIGFGSPIMDSRESAGVAILIALLVMVIILRLVYVRFFLK